MKYELTENVKKSIQEFEEILHKLVENKKEQEIDLDLLKEKIENAILLITKLEK